MADDRVPGNGTIYAELQTPVRIQQVWKAQLVKLDGSKFTGVMFFEPRYVWFFLKTVSICGGFSELGKDVNLSQPRITWEESESKNCLSQVGLWAGLWRLVLIVD